jgi:hypothetical protein
VAAALVLIATTAAVAAVSRPGSPGAISVSYGAVATVDFRGVPGQVTIVGTTTSRVSLTGQLHWSGRAPIVATGLDDAGRGLRLAYRCAPASPCNANYRLVVPARTAVVVFQPAGHVVVSGLAGSLKITAAQVDVSATGLRCPSLEAAITSGHLDAEFGAPPRQVSVTLTSAQATVWLPDSAAYTISQQVTAGYLHIGVPQASGSARRVTARISSGELELLPASPAAPAPQ